MTLAACGGGEELTPEGVLPTLPELPEITENEELAVVNDVLSVVEDTYFARYCLVRFDTNGDGMLSMAEAERVERIVRDEDPAELQEDHAWFTSMQGIEYFKNLRVLEVRSSVMAELDLSYNTRLEELRFVLPQNMSRLKRLNISHTKIEELEVPLSELEELLVGDARLERLVVASTDNNLKAIDVRYCADLEELQISDSNLTSLDLRYCPRLRSLIVTSSQLSTIDLTRNSELELLYLGDARLTSINLRYNSELERLLLGGNQLTTLSLKELPKLKELSLKGNPILALDITGLELLEILDVASTRLTTLNTDNNGSLRSLTCSGAKISSLDLTTNRSLMNLECSNNSMTNLSLGANPNPIAVICDNNNYISLDFSQLNIHSWQERSEVQSGSTFAPQSQLELLTLPATTQWVAHTQFTSCPKLRKVILNAVEVPTLLYEGTITPSAATLYVPSEAIASYESSPWAEAFSEIRTL